MSYQLLILVLSAVLFDGTFALAARIDGPANVRNSPDGQVIISLNDNVYVDCDCEGKQKDWYLIGITLGLPPINEEEYHLRADQPIYSQDGKEIGKTIKPLDISGYSLRDGGKIWQITGYTHKKNIRQDSFIQIALDGILSQKGKNLTLDDLRGHIEEYHYEPWIDYQRFKTFIYYDPWMVTDTPADRAILLFYEDQFIAIIHRGYIELSKHPGKKIRSGRKITYFKELDNKIAGEIEEHYGEILETAN